MITIVPNSELPSWLEYPEGYLRLVNQGVTDLTPWHIIGMERVVNRMSGLCSRFPNRNLFPFAIRQDNDLIACWEKTTPGKVVVIKDFATPGWEGFSAYDSFWHWFRAACNDMIDFE